MTFMMLFQEASADPVVTVQTSGSPLGAVVFLAIYVLFIVSMWKVFAKAGEPGWAAIVPIYNLITLMKIANKPIWYIFIGPFGLIPATMAVARRFGKSTGFGLGMVFLPFVFWPMLAFGSTSTTLVANPA